MIDIERIRELEDYLSSMFQSEFPHVDSKSLEEGSLGVRLTNRYLYDREKKTLKLEIDTVVADDSPEWLNPLLNMCMTQIGYMLDDEPISFLTYFSKPRELPEGYTLGDIYLSIIVTDKEFVFHLPLSCAIHLLPEVWLKKMKSHRKHLFCREVIAELEIRARHTR